MLLAFAIVTSVWFYQWQLERYQCFFFLLFSNWVHIILHGFSPLLGDWKRKERGHGSHFWVDSIWKKLVSYALFPCSGTVDDTTARWSDALSTHFETHRVNFYVDLHIIDSTQSESFIIFLSLSRRLEDGLNGECGWKTVITECSMAKQKETIWKICHWKFDLKLSNEIQKLQGH